MSEHRIRQLAEAFTATTVVLVSLYVVGLVYNYGYFQYFGILYSTLHPAFHETITIPPRLLILVTVCYASYRAWGALPSVWKYFIQRMRKRDTGECDPVVGQWGLFVVLIPAIWMGFVAAWLVGFDCGQTVAESTCVLVVGLILSSWDKELTGARLYLLGTVGIASLTISVATFGVIAARANEENLPTIAITLTGEKEIVAGQLLYFNGSQYFVRNQLTTDIQIVDQGQVRHATYHESQLDDAIQRLFRSRRDQQTQGADVKKSADSDDEKPEPASPMSSDNPGSGQLPAE